MGYTAAVGEAEKMRHYRERIALREAGVPQPPGRVSADLWLALAMAGLSFAEFGLLALVGLRARGAVALAIPSLALFSFPLAQAAYLGHVERMRAWGTAAKRIVPDELRPALARQIREERSKRAKEERSRRNLPLVSLGRIPWPPRKQSRRVAVSGGLAFFAGTVCIALGVGKDIPVLFFAGLCLGAVACGWALLAGKAPR
jgi:hypothetical protein